MDNQLQTVKTSTSKLTPSQLLQKQQTGDIIDNKQHKPKIIQFLNLADYSIYTDSRVPVDEPIFQSIPNMITFTDYQPLQIKEKIFKLRNKDKFVRRIKIIQPDSRLFQVLNNSKKPMDFNTKGNKVAPGMEITFLIRFSPEAKIDYSYDLVVVTEREKFVVPIQAIGKRSMIDFPDVLDFENCPVKYITEKPVIIRNLGEKTTKWFLRMPAGFDCNKKEGVLESQNNEQIIVKFFPQEARQYKNEVELRYDDLQAYIPIMGKAYNGNVYLSKSHIQMEDAYIGLKTQQILHIVNKSNVKVDFQWRSFKTEKEEQDKKNRLYIQLDTEESEERMMLKEVVQNELVNEVSFDDFDDSDDEEHDEKAVMLKRQKKAELQLARKYKNIRKAIDDDMLLFEDEIFQIEPQTGEIWPNSKMTITISFIPQSALNYSCTCFCNISCSDERLQLHLAGEGIGPKAFLSTTEIPIGDIFVTDEFSTDVTIENRGEIEAKFELTPNSSPFGKMFKFNIEEGVLGVGEKIPLNISFCSTILGEFSETFRWQLGGSSESLGDSSEILQILFTGHVMAPSFLFNVDCIDYGKVSYSFPNRQVVKFSNTSTVPFKFQLRIPGDGKLSEKEFDIKPSKDLIQPKSTIEIEIIFISLMPRKYDMVMVVDIDGVGQDMYSLPIRAESEVPLVKIEPMKLLQFNQIFLRNPDVKQILLTNDSSLQAKFQVLPQSEESKVLAEYHVDQESGQIEQHGQSIINVTLITKKLGEITLPLSINIVGNQNNNPHTINIQATSTGPEVVVSDKELDFGTVAVLKDSIKKITIKNTSQIEADFHVFTKKKPKETVFKPIQKHGLLKPHESMDIEVVCNPDEANKFQDTLHFVIREGLDVDVQLKAKGEGQTIFYKDDLENINFGTLYTCRPMTKDIFVENKGRKTQVLSWVKKKMLTKQNKDAKKEGKKEIEAPVEEESVFQIYPEKVSIPSKHGFMFQFKALTTKKGLQSEQYTLNVGSSNDRKSTVMLTSTIQGDFIAPSLNFSNQKLNFKYLWEKGVPMIPISQTLEMTCGSSLPTNFALKTVQPFSISQENFSLQPGKNAFVRIDFDPGMKTDRISGLNNGKLLVIHADHPHRDNIELIGELCFPNLTFETQNLNFGSILCETTKKMNIKIQNVSEMSFSYQWNFLEDEMENFSINEIFDILPLSGYLQPGESENVEFIFNSVVNHKVKAVAVCHVEGGPDYEVTLEGDSSLISYKLSTNLLELGDQRFSDWVQKEFFIENTGKVQFNFSISLNKIIRKGLVEVLPKSGKINGNEKQKIVVRICPGMPDTIKEQLVVEIGYFEPEIIKIEGKGTQPALVFSLPREISEGFVSQFLNEKNKIRGNDAKYLEQFLFQEEKYQNFDQQFKGGEINLTNDQLTRAEYQSNRIETEIDRKAFCEQIILNINDMNQPKDPRNTSTSGLAIDKQVNKIYDKIVVSTLICDFGNVVINSLKKKTFKITNTGTLHADVVFDTKAYKSAGFTINPEKAQKLPPDSPYHFTISYQAKKNSKFGHQITQVPMEVKGGPRYILELRANITIPEITIENLNQEVIDFLDVIIGQRKTMYIRFVNNKEITCEWNVTPRNELLSGSDKGAETRFSMNPSSGIILPGAKQLVELTFIPSASVCLNYKFCIVIKENPKNLIISVKGSGTYVSLDIFKDKFEIGPVLPYDDCAYQKVEFKNNSDFETELFSLDYDTQYAQEEEALRKYFTSSNQQTLFVPVREPGKPFWDFIIKDNDRNDKKNLLLKQMETANESQMEQLNREMDELNVVDSLQPPVQVESDKLHHVIIYGPPGCGKSTVIRNLSKSHRRAIVNMNELYDWNLQNKTQAAANAEIVLNAQIKMLEEIKIERETLIKKAGKKGPQVEQELGPLDESIFYFLPEENLCELLNERVIHPEAGAGCLFDNLKSKYYASELIALKVIMKVVKNYRLQLVLFQGLKDADGLDVCKPIELDQMEKILMDTFNSQKIIDDKGKKPTKGKPAAKKESNQKKSITINQDTTKISEKPLFEIFYPRGFEDEHHQEVYDRLCNDLLLLFQNQVEKIPLDRLKQPLLVNPFEEQRKIAAVKKDPKAKPQEVVEVDIEEQRRQSWLLLKNELISPKRDITYIPIHFNMNQLFKTVSQEVESPIYPDPNELPVPEPIYHQVIVKPNDRTQKKGIKGFQLLTPKKMYKDEQDNENLLENLENSRVRWIIPAKKTLVLLVKFFTTSIGKFEAKLEFESFFSIKPYCLSVTGVSDFPQISNLPKNIFYSWKKSRPLTAPECYLSKTYVQSENVYDFGPLLIGKNPLNKEKFCGTNSSTFRISNQGRFDCHVDFALMSSVIENDHLYSKNVFFFDPPSLVIKVNDVPQEIRVWALPDQPQKFKDELIIMIKENPIPVILPICCMGQKPMLEIVEGQKLVFTRLLLNQSTTKSVKIKNKCAIPIKWRLKDFENLPNEFQVQNTFGELKPYQETIVSITFKALIQMKFSNKLTIEVQDTENMLLFQEPLIIDIEAEAFNISVDIKMNNTENILDFGAIKVGEIKEQSLFLKNIGLYNVKFNFNMKKKQFRECFTIEPQESELDPNQEKEIKVRFICNKEMKLKTQNTTTDITLEILEGKTKELFKPVPINVAVNAVYSKYSISPMNSINFGSLQFNETKTRILEIKNDGLFDFNFTIFDYHNEEARKEINEANELYKESLKVLQVQVDNKGKKDTKKDNKPPAAAASKKDDKKKPGVEGGLTIGGIWKINPPIGCIPAESSINIEVQFIGNSQKLYEQQIGIDVQGRDPEDQPQGILYQFIGESCIPGIITEEFESVFEEQIVMQSINQSMTQMINSNVFGVEEKCFMFGTLFPSKNPDGIVEKFKITNFNKIPCTVKFDVRKRSEKQTEQFAFEVFPKMVKILPHEYTYVKVSFKPNIMAQYAGIFEAIVESGEQNPKTHKLLFDLRGEGALPTLKIEKPKDWFDERTLVMKFPKTRVNKSHVLPILLKNDGMVPATCRFDLNQNENFRFLKESSYTLAPKTYHSFDIEFTPKAPGPKQWQIGVQTLLNPYEISRVLINGDAFHEDILFENLPKDLEDTIEMGDCVINQENRIVFAVRNNSESQLKFNFNTMGISDIVFLPSRGHLNKGQSKSISLIFKSDKSVTYKDQQLVCETQHMEQTHSFSDWDDSKTTVRYVSQLEFDYWKKRKADEIIRKKEDDANKAKKKDTKKTAVEEKVPDFSSELDHNVALEEVVHEPPHQMKDKTERQIQLKFSGVTDFANYEVESKSIHFNPTMMFTQRSHVFKIKNTSLIHMNYRCKIVNAETGIPDTGYFSINPKQGIISPSCDEQITVKFSPTECDESNLRLLVISIENLHPQKEKLIIELDAESERPICHFELPPNPYKKRELDSSKYKFLDFDSIGTKVLNTKRFYVANPTSQGYAFEWRQIEQAQSTGKDQHNYIKCKTTKGLILSGKKFEMIFEYLPETFGAHESFWVFEIPGLKQMQHFYIFGEVKEPNVFIDTGKVNFGPLLLNGKAKETVRIKNLEGVPIQFNFDKESLKGDADIECITVNPMSGVVKANSDQPIDITFIPKEEKSFNFNILCFMKRKSRPIQLNIKGIGYQMHQQVLLDNAIVKLEENTVVHMGDIYINEKQNKSLTILNKGDFNFDFMIKKPNFLNYMQITPENGTVKKQDKLVIDLQFAPLTECSLLPKASKFQLFLNSGPTYSFQLQASARKPLIELNQYTFDFGPCFVMKQPLPQIMHLTLINRDNSAMTIESSFQKNPYLDFKLDQGQVLLPYVNNSKVKTNNDISVPIIFTPRDFIHYNEVIRLNINNMHTMEVIVKGEGVPMKLELEKSEDQLIDLGVQRVGSDHTKTICLINQSKKQVRLSLDCGDQIKELQKFALSINPLTEITIPPRDKQEIEIRFKPQMRLHEFKQDIHYKIIENQEVRKLLTISGCSHGVELKLIESTIGFGAVVINSKLTRSISLSNLGDIGCHFSWDQRFCSKFFTISPDQGFLPPHDELKFDITFHPDVVDNDIRFMKVKCAIQESDPIFINLIGKCIQQPKENIQDINFNTVVRTQQIQTINLKNPTSNVWRIKVQCSSNLDSFKGYFSGNEQLDIQPNSSADYQVTYLPLSMTNNEHVIIQFQHKGVDLHRGTLFFPLPDGSALLYNLNGKSNPPEAQQTIEVHMKAKETKTQAIMVKNWLGVNQRFSVSWTMDINDPGTIISGANTIDLAAHASKEYKINFYSLKVINQKIQVTFRNMETNEYIFYKMNLILSAANIQGAFELSSIARETKTKIITIENPMNKPIQVNKEHLTCDYENIYFQPNSFTIPSKSEFGLEIQFRPLVVGQVNAKMAIKHPELGESQYTLALTGLAQTTQKSLNFRTTLGTEIIQTFKFINYLRKPTSYVCRVEKLGAPKNVDPKAKGPVSDFTLDVNELKTLAVENFEGKEEGVSIRFEPSSMADSKAILYITSNEGGEYQCMLNGFCQAPQPKGPFKITGAKPPSIDFKNPFFDSMEFIIRIDNPSFVCSTKSPIKIDAKKLISLQLTYKATTDLPSNGRLTIQTGDLPPWVFYLQGE